MEDLENPIDDPNQPTVTEELLQIVEEFADYIDKFMFEIVTFLAVIDSSMGLIKDVLGMFGFAGWKMTFFPSFSFVVTIGVFLFGTNKRKGKRKAEAAQLEGLGEAMEMIEDVFEVMDDVMDAVEEVEGEAGTLGLGDYSESEDDDDDDNGGQNAIEAETNGVDETSEKDDAVDKIDVVTDENNQDISQQDVKAEVEPRESALRKVIGIAIIAARIASKVTKKRQQDQEDGQKEESVNLEGKTGDCGTENENDGESMTGTNEPPTDNKSKQLNNTCNQSVLGGLTLGEDGTELKNEASGLVEVVKEDSIKAAELVRVNSLGASNVVQGSTKQVLTSTGALKVGHGSYREADFITGHLNKEGKAIAKSVEKDTIEKTRLLKDNEIVKASGVDKASTAVSREATFIAGNLNQEAKTTLHNDKQGEIRVKRNPNTSEAKVTGDKSGLSSSQQGNKEVHTSSKTRNVHQASTKHSPDEVARQERETKEKTNTVSVTDISKQRQQKEKTDSEGDLPYEAHPAENVQQSFQDISKIGDICEEKQDIEKGRKKVGTETSKSRGNQDPERLITTHEVLPENTAVKGEKKTKQASETEESQDPERLIPEPLPGVPDMASNVTEGAPTAAGGASAAASQAKQGLKQTGKKSKGLLQIAMRLVRLIMRVTKRGNSASSSRDSSRRGSTASGTGSLGGEPAKAKRSASGGGDGSAPDIAGAASASMAMGSGGAKGGKIGAIVGIVVRVVRLASKLKGGQKDPSNSDLRSSKESIDLESDSEFFDCGEEFPTQEIQTQTEDRLSLLSMATQTTQTDAGSTWTVSARDSGDLIDMRSDESENNLRRYVHAFQADAAVQREGSLTGSQTNRHEDTYQGGSNDMPSHDQAANGKNHNVRVNQTRQLDNMVQSYHVNRDIPTSFSRDQKGTHLEELEGDDRERTTRRNSTGSLQKITLKILSPNVDPSSPEAKNNPDLNSVLLDIDAPVVLHYIRDFRPSPNDVNIVANGNQQIIEKQTLKDEGRRTQQRDVSKDEFSVRQGNLYKSSSVDLDELEKQTHESRSSTLYDSGTDISDMSLSRHGTIVPYSSSSEDLHESTPILPRRRPTVVRFEDECEYSYTYDENEPVASYREKKKKNLLSRNKNQQGKSSGLKKYSSLEKLDYRFPEDRDKSDYEPSAVCVSGCDQESTRLLPEYEKPSIEPSNIFAARKSRLSGSQTSYFGDDEWDKPEALC
ncbi:uncharacterized protein LOC116298424 [Actinia tenebrosa]|uniref:Uncharacterized protein LOC116298424 n=1 Tax=Actinia tenebrosa TaxID=6105 RepID=A0A6P8IBD7_ACTTE|nr:uncharacterized protein LOC116298424 [Actinia tenebrosa]